MKTIRHKFIKGITRDTSQDISDNTSMYHASNVRLMETEDSMLTSITNLEGNSVEVSQADRNGYEPIGSIYFTDRTVIFYALKNSTTPSAANTAYIDQIRYDPTSGYSREELWTGTGLSLVAANPISGVGRFESESSIKIYWTDGYNNVRFANIAPDTPGGSVYSNVLAMTASDFDIINDMDFEDVEFQNYISGSFITGTVEYAYRMSKENGTVTAFGGLSNKITLTSSVKTDTSRELFGNDVNSFVGVGVQASIALTAEAQNYDYIEIISIHYTSAGTTPTLSSLGIFSVSGSTINFVDLGINYEGTISLSEFNLASVTFSAGDLETKDNILFAANTEDDVFDVDVDMRMYRYYDTGGGYRCDLFDNNGLSMITNTVGSSNWDLYTYNAGSLYVFASYTLTTLSKYTTATIPTSYDCVNPYNIKDQDGISLVYSDDSTGNLGATGLNSSLIFNYNAYEIEEGSVNIATVLRTDLTSTNRDWILGNKRSYKRNEIYRFGVVFIDAKGRYSPVKWMLDCRIPDNSSLPFAYSSTNDTFARAINPLFTIDTTGTPAQGLDYFIVRAPRFDYDRTILGQGIIAQNMIYTNSTPNSIRGTVVTEYINSAEYAAIRNVVDFISPSYLVGNDIQFITGDRLETVLRAAGEDEVSDPTTWTGSDATLQAIKYRGTTTVTSESRDIVTLSIFTPYQSTAELAAAEGSVEILGTPYEHWHEVDDAGAKHYGIKPTTAVIEFGANFDNTGFTGRQVPIVDYVRNIIPYGGYSYESRLNTEYIQCADINSGASFQGDTFICMFDYLRWIYTYDALPDSTGNMGVAFPVESYQNTALLTNTSFFKLTSGTDDKTYLKEQSGAYPKRTPSSDTYVQEYDLYTYNTAYNAESNSKFYAERGEDDPDETKFQSRIRYSDTKISGERSDSWTVFRSENFNEVEPTYGGIEKLEIFNNQLYVFQNTGVSIASVNTRVTQLGDDGITTVLGKGDVLDYFNYITTSVGIQDNCDIVKTPSSLHWIDTRKKRWYKINSEGISSVSDGLKVQSWFNNAITQDCSIHGIYDRKYNEVLFSLVLNTYSSLAPVTILGPGNPRLSYTYSRLGNYTIFRLDREINIIDTSGVNNFYKVDAITTTNIDLIRQDYTGAEVPISANVDMNQYTYEPAEGTFVFSEKANGLVYETVKSDLFIDIAEDYLSYTDTTTNPDLYIHNNGSINTFYGSTIPSTIDIIVSAPGAESKEFVAGSVNMETFDSDGFILEDICFETVMLDNVDMRSDEMTIMEIADVTAAEGANKTVYDTNGGNAVLGDSTLYNTKKVLSDWHFPLPLQTIDDITYAAYSGITTYAKESIVLYNDKLYKSKTNSNLGNTPSGTKVDTSYWEYYIVQDRIRGNYARVRLKLNNTYKQKINSLEIIYDDIIR